MLVLHEDQAAEVRWQASLDALRKLSETHASEELDSALTYFQSNHHRMDYPAYEAEGYHITSSTVECAGLCREHNTSLCSDSNGRIINGKTTGPGTSQDWQLDHKNESHSL